MRAWLAATLLTTFLAGCSGGIGPSAFLLTPADVPGACHYTTDGEWAFFDELREEYDWTSNPGTFDASRAFDLTGNQTPHVAMLSLVTCEDRTAISWSLAFQDAATAEEVAHGFADCDNEWGDPTFVRGNMLGQLELDDWEDEAVVDAVVERVAQRLGVQAWCPPDTV